MSENDDWIRGREAFHLMIKVGSIGTAAARLREPCARGRIRARALDGTLTLRHGHGEKVVQDWDVPKEVWAGGFNNSSFQISEGRYHSEDFGTGYRAVDLSGLQFSRNDIATYFGIDAAPQPRQAESPAGDNGGRPLDKELWGNLMAALAVYAQSTGGIEPGEKAGTLYRKVTEFGSSLGLDSFIGIDSCREYLNLTMKLAKDAENIG